jgi:amidohydrolase family protein
MRTDNLPVNVSPRSSRRTRSSFGFAEEPQTLRGLRVLRGKGFWASVTLAAALAFGPTGAAKPAGPLYAIKGVKIFTAAGAPIDNGTIVMRNGVIEDVGAGVTAPADAVVIDGTGMNAYPGLIDMTNDAPIDTGEDPAVATAAGRGGGGGGGGRGGAPAQTFATLEEAERVKRAAIMRPDFLAAEHLRTSSQALTSLANAGVTSVLAIPSTGIFRGQSALVNTAIPPDDPQISTIADYRKGLAVVKSPVAMHVNMAGRGGGQGYPGALLGTIAFTKQGFLDAQWQRDAEAHYTRTGGKGPRPLIEPALDALRPALARQMPVALDAGQAREIDRALAIAAQFNLDPIVVGASEANERVAELQKAKARVIYSLSFPGGRGGGAGAGGGGGGGRGGGGAAPSLAQLKAQQNAPKIPAALAQSSIPFAFTSEDLPAPVEFVRNAGRTVKEGGLPADAALRALTIDAARIAGAADRIGSLEKGKIANVVVTQGDLLDGGTVRHVFIDGRPIDLTPATQTTGTGRGRGGN